MRAVLPGCMKRGTKIVSNQGWINPEGAAERMVYWLRELGFRGVKVAAVSGSLITDRVLDHTNAILENGQLGGGVSRSLCLDNYGKALCSAILAYPIEVTERLQNQLRGL